MFAPRLGGLWVGYALGGFSFVNNGRIKSYAHETGSVYGFAQDREGVVWAGTSTGLWRLDGSDWQHVGVEWNIAALPTRQIGFDAQGTLWALVGALDNPKELLYLTPGTHYFNSAGKNLSFVHFTFDADRAVLTDPAPSAVPVGGTGEKPLVYPLLSNALQFVDRNESLWTAPADKAMVMRLPKAALFESSKTATPSSSESYDINPFEMATLVDREGNVWLADPKGIHRFFYTRVIRQQFPANLAESSNIAVVADERGEVWVSFTNSLAGLPSLYHVSAEHTEPNLPRVTAVSYRASDNTIWFSGAGCLWHLVGHDFIRVELPPEMVKNSGFLDTITEDRNEGLWVSFGRRGLYRLANGQWTPNGGRSDLPKAVMVISFTDSVGRVWFGYANNQVAMLDRGDLHVFGPEEGVRLGTTLAIYGRGLNVWIGGEFGLEHFDDRGFLRIAAANEELLGGISGIVETPEGDLWLNGTSGIFHIRKAEIARALRDSTYRVNGEHIGRRDGLPGVANQSRPLPTAIEGTDGRLWFTLTNGVVSIDPADHTDERSAPPPIVIQSISADDKSYLPNNSLSLPARTSSVQISYSAVSLSDPDAIRFRYKLQETDVDWHEAAAANPVNYRNLPPGTYHFSVSASDTNGAWSDKIATAEFTVSPLFYQTLWFPALCVILLLTLLAELYRRRLRQLARQYDMRLEERVGERTRIARELHDTLLQSFQGLLLRFQVAYEFLPARPAEAKQDLGQAIDRTVQALDEGRTAVQGLRAAAINDVDLLAGLQMLVEVMATDKMAIGISVEGTVRPLHPMARDEIYRIAGEALRNAHRHAHASEIEVDLRYDDSDFHLRVRDNGKGIDQLLVSVESAQGHYGLAGMRERARLLSGELNIWSAPASGTEVELTVPAARVYAAKHPTLLNRIIRNRSATRADE